MQEFDHIEAIWAGHKVDIKISAEEMLKQAKREVGNIKTRSLANIMGMTLSFLAVMAVWLYIPFQPFSTHLGISIILIAVAVYTVILYNNYRIIAKSNFTLHPKIFLEQLKAYQLTRLKLYNKLYWFYTLALSLGMALYFIEILAHMEIWLLMVILIFTFGWIILCSTLIRRAVIKREKERISLLIEKFERITEQFN